VTVRIALLGPLPPPYSGPEVMTKALVDALRSRDAIEFRHLNTQVSRSLADKRGRGRQLSKALTGAIQALRLLVLLAWYRPSIVYLPLTNSPSFLGFLRDCQLMVPALLLRRQVMMRLHGGYYFYAHVQGLKRKLVGAVLGRVSLAMVQGERLVTAFDGLVPAERITVITNGLDDAPFAAARQRLAATGGRPAGRRPRVLFVGLMCREKGFRDIIAAVPQVPDAEFVFAGEWPTPEEEAEVRAEVQQAGVADRVTFAGVVSGNAKYDLFTSCDIFVFPTYYVYEGHAVSSVEALAAGLPIVCTDHGALNESVREGWNGFFVPKSAPAAIAERLQQLVGDERLRSTMGARSRELFEQRFTLQRFVDAWVAAVVGAAAPASGDRRASGAAHRRGAY
jgi:glycosyltransferase involved in cell wall biosynthesis